MKALSVRQPWPWCIFHVGKDIENRSWRTRFRGRLLIHASKGMTRDEYEDCLATVHALGMTVPFPAGLTMPAPEELERGVLLGTVEVVDCVKASLSLWFSGPYGFVLRDPRLFDRPIAFTGARGLFDVPDDLVREALA
ncbi:ASCH domain-containing protein [Rhodopseudomonas sp. HC1]|uniref:ASCH domain-containing protein n=1 Tax=Rhodopseudomonas infernalis TaxID=2897386 RepID=UPI001EE8558D|nr:ASCH domain-containing protein [Rhodopseudomonas infernalis]MCG6204177.1 ASCH domain-containing protein [Rhodopseudomonas infernalis]